MILEGQSGNYLDSDAFDAAYRALMPFNPIAQARATIAETVVATLIEQRATNGIDHLRDLAQSPTLRLPLVEQIKAQLSGSLNAPRTGVDEAIAAGAAALS